MPIQVPSCKAYFRAMQQFTVTHPVELIEALMSHVGYPTRTKARNALKREEILVNGHVALKGSDILEPGTEVSVLSKEEVAQQKRNGGAAPKNKDRKLQASAQLARTLSRGVRRRQRVHL